jgi:predicted short-subunit dehydrogenase-like oxidoreductase (DUF2520 family)
MEGTTEPGDAAAREPSEGLRGVAIAVIGAGAVGSAFAVDLAFAGADVRVASRTPARAEELARRTRGARASPPSEAVRGARLVLLAVSDGALSDAADELSAALSPGAPAGSAPVFLHTNGFHGLAVLQALERRGSPVGKVHPLSAVPAGGLSGTLRGAWIATAGSPAALPWIARLVRAVGGHELRLGDAEGDSRRLHAAATLLSGGLVALFDAALAAARAPTIAEGPLADALRSLLRSTAANLESFEPAEALTGPVARGSLDVVRGHLEALEKREPDLARLYRELGRRMLALARERGTLDADRTRELEGLLAPNPRAFE